MSQKKLQIFFFIFFFIYAFYSENFELSAKKKKNLNYERFWIQYSEENSILFRFLTENQNQKCPNLFFDNLEVKTIEREHSYKEEFPVKICQAVFKNDQKDHEIKFKNSKINIYGNLEKISTIGDTGCVVQKNKLTGKNFEQNCLDPKKYPFKINAEKIQSERPDLIVHVGDYFYTDAKCQDASKCGGRPYGDKFLTWRIDFLDSAKSLFETAPIIFARGNHEKCNRGGKGWAVLFDNSIEFKKCSNYDSAFKVKFENIDFLVIDSSDSDDLVEIKTKEDKEKIEFYSSEFQKILSDVNSKKINAILTHRPIFAWEFREWKKFKEPNQLNMILSHALFSVSKTKLKNIDFVLSGHIHMAAMIDIRNYNKNLNIKQIISGNGGVSLNSANHYNGQKTIFDKKNKVFSYSQINQFGFTNIFLSKRENFVEFLTLKK